MKIRINAKSCAGLPIALPQVLTTSGPRRTATPPEKGGSGVRFFSLREGEAPAEPNTCLAARSRGAAETSPLREGEAPAEPNTRRATGSRSSAGDSPLREGASTSRNWIKRLGGSLALPRGERRGGRLALPRGNGSAGDSHSQRGTARREPRPPKGDRLGGRLALPRTRLWMPPQLVPFMVKMLRHSAHFL